MKLKTCILPLLVLLLLVSYYVNAAETSQDDIKANEMAGREEEPKQPEQSGRHGCRFGCCGGYTRFGCRACCRPHESDVVAEKNVYVGTDDDDDYGWGEGGRGGFGFGWGGRGGGGGGWGGWGGGGGGWGGGGGCRYGCCGHRYERCYKCCYSAAEAKAYNENEAHHHP